jgi:hypothetical protein
MTAPLSPQQPPRQRQSPPALSPLPPHPVAATLCTHLSSSLYFAAAPNPLLPLSPLPAGLSILLSTHPFMLQLMTPPSWRGVSLRFKISPQRSICWAGRAAVAARGLTADRGQQRRAGAINLREARVKARLLHWVCAAPSQARQTRTNGREEAGRGKNREEGRQFW